MKSSIACRLPPALVLVAVLAVIVASFADSSDQVAGKAHYSVAGHTFGLGEQQVYVIHKIATLTINYRDRGHSLHSQTFRQDVRTSVAWTVEGLSSSGGPILGVASAPMPARRPSQLPSPMLDASGVGSSTGDLAELAPASFLLSGLTPNLPDIGKPWSSDGLLALRYGVMMIYMNNVVTQPLGTAGDVVQVASTGGTAMHGKISTPALGTVDLDGKGGATAQSYLEPQNHLLLGMTLIAFNHGRSKAKDITGTYDLNVSVSTKLVRYIPGVTPYSGGPGYVFPSGYVGSTAQPDTSLYSTSEPEQVASPAATNTEFIPAPMEPITPYPSALPEVSLPPIPIPWSSDQPVASPPPPPTPVPTPTRLY